MRSELVERIQHEIRHGATDAAVRQAEHGWASAAGKIRRGRRGEFLVRGLPRTTRVLEIGSGTGLHTIALLEAFDDVVAIDISPELLAHAEKVAPRAQMYVMDAHQPDFPDSSFDAIVGVSVLHHLDWDLALGRYIAQLKPGGVVRFSEPNLLNPQIFLQKNVGILKRLAGDSPGEYAFTRWQIARSLRNAGFVDISVTPFEFLHPGTPKGLIPLLVKLESWLPKTPLNEIAGSLLIEARKPS